MSHSKTTHTPVAQETQNEPHAVPTHGDIAERAFEIYVKTGRRQGQCKQNWQQAEQDLRNQGKAECHSTQCSGDSPDGHHQHRHHHRG